MPRAARACGYAVVAAALLTGCAALGHEPSDFMEGRVADLHLFEEQVGDAAYQWVGPWLCSSPKSPATLKSVEVTTLDGVVVEDIGVRTVETMGVQDFPLLDRRPLSAKYAPVGGFVVDTPCKNAGQAVELGIQLRRTEEVGEARGIRIRYEEDGDQRVHEMPGVVLTVCAATCPPAD